MSLRKFVSLGSTVAALAALAAMPASAKDIRFTLGEYSANTKMVTTADELLQQTIDMKR